MIRIDKKFKIDYEGLKAYLEGLTSADFRGEDGHCGTNPNGKIRKGTSISYILYLKKMKKDTTKILFSDVIAYGQPFLVDLLGNDLSIATLTKRKYRTPNDRSVHAKFDITIINNCHNQYGTALNGCWIIPDEFIVYY